MICSVCKNEVSHVKFEDKKMVCFDCIEEAKPKAFPGVVFKGGGWTKQPKPKGMFNIHK